jgi:hypothetical protein
MEQYRFNLQSSVANINEAMEGIQVNAMEGLTDGLAGAIAGTQKLGDVFKNVAAQIIADLIRIQIQKAIVGTLGNALGGLGSVFGGGSTSLGMAGGGFGGSEDWNSLPTFSSTPKYAKGTRFSIGGRALVGDLGPELLDLPRGSEIIPNNELSQLGGEGGTTNNYYTLPSEDFWGEVDSRGGRTANTAISRERQTSARKAQRKLGKR